ncbi:DUF2934 domain-containing protein [Amaricoccus sp.]|uniref:DUF2934 domain-containing protein n=1 Tax=Amaricoccus sp. TaxID=1872485 RepID=UPI0026226A07|nr:DUF2934 domain-containing protein [Amaricoccus sp.]HRO10141.1 DUF2934 domain-containing protein [Amaricoccus sp.]
MIQEIEHRIRERAHQIWESEGRPSGRADAHWSMASAEIAAAGQADAAPKPAAKPRVRKAAAAEVTAARAPRPKTTRKPPLT